MPRPAKPAAGDLIVASFGDALMAYAAEGMEFIRPRAVHTWDVNGAAGTGALVEAVLAVIPPNDPSILYAHIEIMVRDNSGGNNYAMSVRGDPTNIDGITYSTGTSSRGGAGGPFMCRLGGATNQSVWWLGTTGSTCWLTVLGYWRRVG